MVTGGHDDLLSIRDVPAVVEGHVVTAWRKVFTRTRGRDQSNAVPSTSVAIGTVSTAPSTM